MNIGITFASIKGLEEKTHLCKDGLWAMDLNFNELIFASTNTKASVFMGKSCNEANYLYYILKCSLDQKSIKEGDKVAVIFDDDNNKLIAIGTSCDSDWIDMCGDFSIKPFNKLNIEENSVILISKA